MSPQPHLSTCQTVTAGTWGFVPRIPVKQVHPHLCPLSYYSLFLTSFCRRRLSFSSNIRAEMEETGEAFQKETDDEKQSMRCFLFLSRTSTGGNCIPAQVCICFMRNTFRSALTVKLSGSSYPNLRFF